MTIRLTREGGPLASVQIQPSFKTRQRYLYPQWLAGEPGCASSRSSSAFCSFLKNMPQQIRVQSRLRLRHELAEMSAALQGKTLTKQSKTVAHTNTCLWCGGPYWTTEHFVLSNLSNLHIQSFRHRAMSHISICSGWSAYFRGQQLHPKRVP